MDRIVKGIYVPIDIWEDRSLTWNEKVLLMEVDSFTSKGRECYISNEYIADLLDVSADRAGRTLSGLIKKGLVRVVKFDGRKRWIESNMQCRLGENNEADSAKTPRQTRQIYRDTGYNTTAVESTGSSGVCIDERDIDKRSSIPHAHTREGFDFRAALVRLGVTPQVADDWMKVRHTKRATNTETAFNNIAREIEKSGRPADDCIRFVVERSWSGFKADWMNEDRPGLSSRTAAPQRESLIEHYARVHRELEQIIPGYGNHIDNQ